jgi:hypothetical protein
MSRRRAPDRLHRRDLARLLADQRRHRVRHQHQRRQQRQQRDDVEDASHALDAGLAGVAARLLDHRHVVERGERRRRAQLVADGRDGALGRQPAAVAQPQGEGRVAGRATQRGHRLRRRVERDPVVGRVVLAARQVAADAGDLEGADAAVGGDQTRGIALGGVEALGLGVVLIGEQGPGSGRRAGVDADHVGSLAGVVGHADHDRPLAPLADPHARGEQAPGLDRRYVGQAAERRQLGGAELQRLHRDGHVGAQAGGDLAVHGLLHDLRDGEDAYAGDRQREREDGEERARLAARQVRDGLADDGRHVSLLTPRRCRRGW